MRKRREGEKRYEGDKGEEEMILSGHVPLYNKTVFEQVTEV
jgi:hypothetical protein